MAKKISKIDEMVAKIADVLRTMDNNDLTYMLVTARRIALPVVKDAEEVIEEVTPEIVEDDEFGDFGDGDNQEPEPKNEEDDFSDAGDFGDEAPEPEGEGEELNFEEGDDNFEEPNFEDEEPKPVSRRTQRETKPEPKPKAQPKKEEPEYELVEIPGKRLEHADISEDKTRAELGNKLKEIGVSVKAMPEGTKTSKEDLLKGIRMIYNNAYGKKAKSLETMVKMAHKNGIDFAPRKGNRADALKVQMYVVALINQGAIAWPGYSA